jgi:type VI secretion system ImpC/EvpB family protein/type VI secretion system ImpB/VipA family protein
MNRDDPSRKTAKPGDPGTAEAWPLKLFIFGEFTSRDQSGPALPVGSVQLPIDKDSFDEVMRRVAGRVSLEIRGFFSEGAHERWIDLPLEGIKSLHPEAVANAVPELRALLEVRRQIAQVREKKLTLEELSSSVSCLQGADRLLEILRTAKSGIPENREAAATPRIPIKPEAAVPPGKKGDLLDSILGMVDLPGAGQSDAAVLPSATDMGRLIAHLGESGASDSALTARAAGELVREVDRILGAQMNLILHHPEFRRLEGLWRGLKLLVERTDFREPIRIEIRNAAKQDLLSSYNEFSDQIKAEGGLDSDALVLAVYTFDRSSRDLEILRRLSEISEALQMPLISSIGFEFLGLESGTDIERLSYLGALFDQPEYAKWKSLRESDASRWLALVFNRFLLRLPYGPEQVRVRAFEFSESLFAPAGDAYLWGNPVWAVASLLTRRFAATGWCLEFTGWDNGVIEDLPIHEIRLRTGESGQSPLEVILDENQRGDLARAGIVTLVSRINTDSAAILSAPTVHAPERYDDSEETRQATRRAALAFQFFVSRMTVCARRLAGAVAPGLSLEMVRTLFREILPQFLPGEKNIEAVEVEVRDSERLLDSYDVHLTFRPEHAGLGLPPVRLQVLVGK